MNISIYQKALTVAIAFGVLGFSHAVSAQEFRITSGVSEDASRQVQKTAVGVADVDLSSPNGARIVLTRIERAAVAVCGGRPDTAASSSDREDFAQCFMAARSDAVTQAHAPLLTAMANAHHDLLLAKN